MTEPANRRPNPNPKPRLESLATLPVFFKLRDKKVVLAGDSEAVAWKAELLAATGALVALFAPHPCEKLAELIADVPNLHWQARGWQADDLVDAALAIADIEDAEQAQLFRSAARAAGVPANVIDRPEWCDFQFGAIVERSPLVIGISTDGAAPVFGQRVRARIEALLPGGFRDWAQAARSWRPFVQERNLDFRARRTFWERFTDLALERPDVAPNGDDLAQLLAQTDAAPQIKTGHIALVGAGPGDPELLTLRAVRALQSADVVLYDDLVSPQTIAMARREATRINVGKRGYKPSCTQDDITQLLVTLGREGKHVVRLKGGDPMIFGRAGEEILAVRAAGIAIDVIPGVTAASAAAAFLQTSLTERTIARRLQFITAHARDGKLPDDLDWRALADPAATSVVYMGVRTLPQFVERVLAEGLSPDTPAVLVERASWPDQRQTRSSIADLPAIVAKMSPAGPCLVMVGAVFRSDD